MMIRLPCTCCGEMKTTDNFHKKTKSKRGYAYRCKSCIKKEYGGGRVHRPSPNISGGRVIVGDILHEEGTIEPNIYVNNIPYIQIVQLTNDNRLCVSLVVDQKDLSYKRGETKILEKKKNKKENNFISVHAYIEGLKKKSERSG